MWSTARTIIRSARPVRKVHRWPAARHDELLVGWTFLLHDSSFLGVNLMSREGNSRPDPVGCYTDEDDRRINCLLSSSAGLIFIRKAVVSSSTRKKRPGHWTLKDSWHRRLVNEPTWRCHQNLLKENLGFKNLLSFASHKSWLLTDDSAVNSRICGS